jgi:branched-chain amino acid transport system substrate-binding protein
MTHLRRIAACLVALSALSLLSSPTLAQDTIKIGFLAELSGKFVAYGVPSLRAAEMAVDAVGGKVAGKKIELVVRDVQSDAQVMVSTMNELTTTQQIGYVVGPIASPIVAAGVPAWRQAKPIWMLPGSSNTNLEAEIGAEKNFFHLYPYAYDYHRPVIAALKEQLGAGKKVGVIYSDGPFGRTHIDIVRKLYPEAGFQIVVEEIVRSNATDMRPALMKMKRAKPDILIALTETTDAVTLAKQAQIVKLDIPYLVGTSFAQYLEWQNAVGPSQEGWMGVTMFISGTTKRPGDPQNRALFPPTEEWEQAYRKRYNSEPDQLAAGTFATMGMLLLAIDRAGADAPEKVAEELRKMKVETILGTGQFAPSPGGTLQQTFNNMGLFQRRNNASVMLYPPEIASGKLEPAKW